MKMQEILDVVAKTTSLPKTIMPTRDAPKRTWYGCLVPYNISELENLDEDTATKCVKEAIEHIGRIISIGGVVEYINHDMYMLADVPVTVIDLPFPGTTRTLATIRVEYMENK